MYYISAVYVDSGFRRQGLGRALSLEVIAAVKAEVRKEGVASAILMVGAEQHGGLQVL